MVEKIIKPIDSAAKCASISKYSSDRQGKESGRRQQSPDSDKPEPTKNGLKNLDNYFASAARKPVEDMTEFGSMFKKMWEDNSRMQESAKILQQEPAKIFHQEPATALQQEPTTVLEQGSAMEAALLENAWIFGISGRYRRTIKK